MENPCNICLIKSCCTDVCNEKFKYSDNILSKLNRLLSKYIYDEGGYRRLNISARTKIKYDNLTSICDENNKQTNKIYNRHVEVRIQQ